MNLYLTVSVTVRISGSVRMVRHKPGSDKDVVEYYELEFKV